MAHSLFNDAERAEAEAEDLISAITCGNYDKAEKYLEDLEENDTILNQFVYTNSPNICTLLNLVLIGRFSPWDQRRNLRMAKLLVEKGADPNFRLFADNNLETTWTIWKSPFELLLEYYLALLRTYPPGSFNFNYPTIRGLELLDTHGLNKEDTNLKSEEIINQTKELFMIFLERGADVNLQTFEDNRTVFHALLNSQMTDFELIKKVVEKGALINLTDSHGVTPIMDTIKKEDEDRAVKVYKYIKGDLGQHLILDAQSCTGESALWRAMFYGKIEMAQVLLNEGAHSYTSTMVQELRIKKLDLYDHKKQLFRYNPVINNLPTLLSPFLNNSSGNLKNNPNPSVFDANLFNETCDTVLSPLVKNGYFADETNESLILNFASEYTEFKNLEKSFVKLSVIPLMFNSDSLKMKCVRKILNQILFSSKPKFVFKYLETLKQKSSNNITRKNNSRQKIRKSTSTPVCISVARNEEYREDDEEKTFSEPEMINDRVIRIGDNWLLTQDPNFNNNNPSSSIVGAAGGSDSTPVETSELEISVDEEHKKTVVRIHQMLQETDDMLERLQSEVDAVSIDERVDRLDRECARVVDDLDRITGNLERLKKDVSCDESLTSCSDYSRDSSSSEENDDEEEEICHEMIVQTITPDLLKTILDSYNVPIGLRSLFELQVAKLQLGATIFRHKLFECDRGGCIGLDTGSDTSSSDSDSLSDSSWETLASDGDDVSVTTSEESSWVTLVDLRGLSRSSSESVPSSGWNSEDEGGWPIGDVVPPPPKPDLDYSTDSDDDNYDNIGGIDFF